MKRYSIAELEKMMDTHDILPDGSVVRKHKVKEIYKRKKVKIPNIETKTDTCICMDCGKIIKISEQSFHLKSCKKKEVNKMGPDGVGCQSSEVGIKDRCFTLRAAIEDHLKKDTKSLMNHSVFQGEQTSDGQHGEMKANIMLAYRHLEDARMRLGKVVQAYDGGKSVYPK